MVDGGLGEVEVAQLAFLFRRHDAFILFAPVGAEYRDHHEQGSGAEDDKVKGIESLHR